MLLLGPVGPAPHSETIRRSAGPGSGSADRHGRVGRHVPHVADASGTGSDHLAFNDKSTGAATVIRPFGTCDGVMIPSTDEGSGSVASGLLIVWLLPFEPEERGTLTHTALVLDALYLTRISQG